MAESLMSYELPWLLSNEQLYEFKTKSFLKYAASWA